VDDSTLLRFEEMLDKGPDNPLMRLSLGQAYVERGDSERALNHLQRALDMDPNYTAAWKWLGKALQTGERIDDARNAFEKGIAVAQVKGDKQIEKELQVFLKRLGG
jgi:Tfp pilus assembly protein PilF